MQGNNEICKLSTCDLGDFCHCCTRRLHRSQIYITLAHMRQCQIRVWFEDAIFQTSWKVVSNNQHQVCSDYCIMMYWVRFSQKFTWSHILGVFTNVLNHLAGEIPLLYYDVLSENFTKNHLITYFRHFYQCPKSPCSVQTFRAKWFWTFLNFTTAKQNLLLKLWRCITISDPLSCVPLPPIPPTHGGTILCEIWNSSLLLQHARVREGVKKKSTFFRKKS